MQQVIEKYKVVRRGPRWCVRVQGIVNTDQAWHWCRERNMEYNIRQRYTVGYTWRHMIDYKTRWDYDFTFDDKNKALTFVLGYL